jgi:hypothetical protein
MERFKESQWTGWATENYQGRARLKRNLVLGMSEMLGLYPLLPLLLQIENDTDTQKSSPVAFFRRWLVLGCVIEAPPYPDHPRS